MQHAYHKFVAEQARLLNAGVSPRAPRPTPSAGRQSPPDGAPTVLVFAPHPDDECITGALPLRLLRELKMRVVNVAVTLGSRKDRRQERWQELQQACDFIGFETLLPAPGGLEKINLDQRQQNPDAWHKAVLIMTDILRRQQPHIVFFPHAGDANSTHIGVNALMTDALAKTGKNFCCWVCESEFWAPMPHPNLMIETSVADTADLVAALAQHAGEVKRNPYHLRLPAWMIDNVRRGGELVGGQGGEPPPFIFATLYRLSKWAHGRLENGASGKMVSANDSLKLLFG
ncbi:MAG: PIG-L deacetylase family protein [Kiritimatiellia bacterium]|jgi:LmbE family N-acetylglucosaminyl deacetylase